MTGFRSRDVIGRKIIAVNLNRFPSGNGTWSFDPEFTLDDGSVLCFSVSEVEDASCYGIDPIVRKKKRKSADGAGLRS